MNKVITISREFGSGGREIAKRLSDELGFTYYDSEIITLLSNSTGLKEEYLRNISEKGIYPYPFQFGKTFSMMSSLQNVQNSVLIEQQKIIKEIAEKGNCIIVGRGADTILKEYHPFKIFVYANLESKVERCMAKAPKEENLSEGELIKKIEKVDKNRRNYNSIISNREWGKKENYDLCINTSNIEIKKIVKPLGDYIRHYFEEVK